MKLRFALAAGAAALFTLAGCSPSRQASDHSLPGPALRDVSGLAWIDGDQFLAVHDTKDARNLPRVSLVRLPQSAIGLIVQPVELSWPEPQGSSGDLESVARIPGTAMLLLAESGSARRGGTDLRRIFLVERRDGGLAIIDVAEWPVPISNVEGTAVARVGEHLVFLFAERAEGQPGTLLRWAPFTAPPLAFGAFQEVSFAVPEPTGPHARPVSAIEIDDAGRIYVASATDPARDNGPFRSVLWRIGRMQAAASVGAALVLDERPERLGTLDGLKVEGLAVRENAGAEPDIFFGTDDENLGGILRLLPGQQDR
jgi:hypothetical protein